MKANQITAIGVSIIALGVIAVGAKYGVKEYQNYKWENNPNTSTFDDINRECIKESIMNTSSDFSLCGRLKLRAKGLSIDEYNEWVKWINSRRFR